MIYKNCKVMLGYFLIPLFSLHNGVMIYRIKSLTKFIFLTRFFLSNFFHVLTVSVCTFRYAVIKTESCVALLKLFSVFSFQYKPCIERCYYLLWSATHLTQRERESQCVCVRERERETWQNNNYQYFYFWQRYKILHIIYY